MPGELSIVETAKQRSLRVPLDYYRRGNGPGRLKFALGGLAALAAALYCVWLAIGGGSARRQLSPGPVASVHGAWNDDCSACHQDFRPLRSDALDWRGLLTSANAAQAADKACSKCHKVAAHHASALAGEEPGCAACHRDHRGTAADLRRAADDHCLSCHRDLPAHRSGPSALTPAIASVTGFGASRSGPQPHPDFRSLESDPGNVKFNHWLHLQPGIAPADAKQKLKAADAALAYRGWANEAGLVQLDCAACHEPEGNGRLMRPIAYEKHCAGCHPLNIPVAGGTGSVPHGLAPVRLAEVVDGLLFQAERDRQGRVAAQADESGERPIVPGRTLGSNLAAKIRADVLGQRRVVANVLNAKCAQCHYAAAGENGGEEAGRGGDFFAARESRIPGRWLAHARFDHSAHRHVQCRSCHQAAYEYENRDQPQFLGPGGTVAGAKMARDDEQVMIAGIESCASCHAPRRGNDGGARHDCAECHEYHGRTPHGGDPRVAADDLRLRLASPATFTSVSLRQPEDLNAGRSGGVSCAASGCHGAVEGEAPAWRSAFTAWAAQDPHVQAYEVLWTPRGREMARLVERQEETLSTAAHEAVIARRCTGCHATATASHDLGVSCESCHGPAEAWEHTHYRILFARTAASGFRDTKVLGERAAACMGCHVGPSDGQVVDHDLIAAGHPRLAFEFRTYAESLPAHWDRATDERRRPGEHHFQSWLAGQAAQRMAGERLEQGRETIDFARLECSSCHHALAHGAWRQAEAGRNVLELREPSGAWQPLVGRTDVPAAERMAMLAELLKGTAERPTWERSLDAYFAAVAVTKDLDGSAELGIGARAGNLGDYLGRQCFAAVIESGRSATIYDSPSGFHPAGAAGVLQALTESVEAHRKRVQNP